MKNKNAADRLGWKAEYVKEGAEEMVKFIYIYMYIYIYYLTGSKQKIKYQNIGIWEQWKEYITVELKEYIKVELKKTFKRIKEGYFWWIQFQNI